MTCPGCRQKMTNGQPGLYTCPGCRGELFLDNTETLEERENYAAAWWLSRQRYTAALRDEKKTSRDIFRAGLLR